MTTATRHTTPLICGVGRTSALTVCGSGAGTTASAAVVGTTLSELATSAPIASPTKVRDRHRRRLGVLVAEENEALVSRISGLDMGHCLLLLE